MSPHNLVGDLVIYVIYDNPSDRPGWFVVRRHRIGPEGVKVEASPFALGTSLEDVRDQLPRGLALVPRSPDDDPVIVESWL